MRRIRRRACGGSRGGVRIGHRVWQDQDVPVRQRERGPQNPLRLRPQDDDLRRGDEHVAHQTLHEPAPCAEVCSVTLDGRLGVVDMEIWNARARAMAVSMSLRRVLPRPVMFMCSRAGWRSPPA